MYGLNKIAQQTIEHNYSVCLILFFLPSVFGSFTAMVNLGGTGPNVVRKLTQPKP